MPWGFEELRAITKQEGRTGRIGCFVRGCERMLQPPARKGGGEVCPEHGIRCHRSGTFSYADVRQNLIVDADLFACRVLGHPFKHESHRFGHENSEDALSWNVFRSLQRAGQLHQVANRIIGQQDTREPRLYLWGLSAWNDQFEPWDLLVRARERFESNLPVKRPLTEPDIALHLPGQYLILVEAKFTSDNPTYQDGPRQNATSLTKAELLAIYWDETCRSLDRANAQSATRVHYQLWRNLIFAEWMAAQEIRGTKAFLASLTREKQRNPTLEFCGLLSPGYEQSFAQITWEEVARSAAEPEQLSELVAYMRSKSASLHKAFNF